MTEVALPEPEPEHRQQSAARPRLASRIFVLCNIVVGGFVGLSFLHVFEFLGLRSLIIDRDLLPPLLILLVVCDALWLSRFALERLSLAIIARRGARLAFSALLLLGFVGAVAYVVLPIVLEVRRLDVGYGRISGGAGGENPTHELNVNGKKTAAHHRPPDNWSHTISGPAPVEPSAYWNTWFEYQGDTAPEALTEGNTYAFAVDISPYEYAGLRDAIALSSGVDPGVRQLLADPNNKQITFRIKPLLAEGGGLRFVTPDQSDVLLKADLQAIRNPDSAAKDRYLAQKISLGEFSDKAAAGNIRFSVSAEEAGCAAVVLAVFSENGRFPLDHLVRWVPIVKARETPPTCESDISGEHVQQYGGLDKLLQVSLELDAAGTSRVADAAFHIFDTSAGSFVIFSDGRPAQQKTIYAWQTGDSLVRFVSDDHRLPKLIQAARDAVTLKKPASYVNAAQELTAVLFGGQSPRDEKEASLAKAAFQDIVAQSSTRPVVIARVVTDSKLGQNQSVFLPLGILGASGEGAVLAHPITVIQPLPREHYGSGPTCVGDWTFGVPAKLERDDEDLSKLWPPDASGKNWFHDLAGLKAYLSDPTPVGSQPGEGFLLLAHHGSGNLWFDDEAQRVIRQNITRDFPGGSVGVFAACSFAAASYDSGFVQRLNEHGVDTLIASPFPVPVDYGTRFALEFPKAIEETRKRFAKPTVSDLFAVAIDMTAIRLADEFKKNYSEMGLEYVLLGSPNTPLCAKPSTGANP